MHTLKLRIPRPELRPYVRIFAQRNTAVTDKLVIEPTTAQLEQILTFELGAIPEILHPNGRIQVCSRVGIAGSQIRFAAHMCLQGDVETFGIFFRPSGLSRLFRVPMCELTNFVGEAAPVVGNSIHALWNRIGEVSSFDERVAIAEEFLLILASTDTAWTIAMAAADYVLRRHGATRIREVVGHFSTGLRQFERNFQREVGTAHKTFARIARFQSALDAKVAAPNRTWLDIAHSFGYHDQMHMIHDFQALGRNTPTHLIAQLGDSRAPAGMSKAA